MVYFTYKFTNLGIDFEYLHNEVKVIENKKIWIAGWEADIPGVLFYV